MSKFKRRLTPVFLAVFLMLTCAPIPTRAAYSDAAGSWAAEVIQKASAYGLMEGYPDGRFGVGEQMKRCEFAAVVCRMFDWIAVTPEEPTYPDCPPSHWAYTYIETLVSQGAADVKNAFRPEDYILRGEMAKILVLALGYDPLANSDTISQFSLPFPDVAENRGYIALAYDFGIIQGIPSENGTLRFLPYDSAPREQAAAMLVRCYERRKLSQPDWINGFYANLSGSPDAMLERGGHMSTVTMAWGYLQFDADATHYRLTTSKEDGNSWYIPDNAEEVTNYLTQRGVACHFSVQTSANPFGRTVDAGQTGELITQLVEAAAPYAGLNIDFEGLRVERREAFTQFIRDLRAALPAEKALTVCVPSDKYYKGYDFRALGELCDKIIYMSHTFCWTSIPESYLGRADTYTPYAPLDEVCRDLHDALDPVTGVQDPSKLALQICFGTVGIQVDEEDCIASTTLYYPGTRTLAKRLRQPDSVRTWDKLAASPYLTYYNEDGDRFKAWYEDAQSVRAKLQLAKMFGVNDISVWYLGSVPDYPDIPNYDLSDFFQMPSDS